MDRLTYYAIILVVSLSCAEFCSVPTSQASPQNKTSKKATGSVSGRITVKGKGKAGILVGLRTGDSWTQTGPLSKAITDEDGNYRITDLPGGKYQVMPVAPAFVISDFNSSGRQGKVVFLTEGENLEDIDFAMVRGGVITGKVTYADGRPVMEEPVHIAQVEQTDRQGPGTVTRSSTSRSTDDRGIYRVFGLLAGKYKVSIGQDADSFSHRGGVPGRSTYALVFHSDPSNPNEAKIFELGEGGEATNIDITVGETISGFAAAGVVIDSETNKPVANLRFGLQKEQRGFTGSSVQTDRLGAFRFENLMPGKYSVVSMPQPNSDLRSDSVTFEVVDQDVTGLIVKASRGASVSGTIVLEGTPDKAVQKKLAQLRLHAYNVNETGGSGFVESASINHDGSFRIVGLQPGVAQFQLAAQDRLRPGFSISRVELQGVVLPRGVEVKAGEQIFGVRIVVNYATGSVRGTIKADNGPLPANAHLMVRLMKPEDPSVTVGHLDIDARGRFAVEGVPAGSYELQVNAFIPGSRGRPPSVRQLVTVTEGSVTEVEVVLVLANTASP